MTAEDKDSKDEKKSEKANRVKLVELAVKELQEQIVKLGKGFGRNIKLERVLNLSEEK